MTSNNFLSPCLRESLKLFVQSQSQVGLQSKTTKPHRITEIDPSYHVNDEQGVENKLDPFFIGFN